MALEKKVDVIGYCKANKDKIGFDDWDALPIETQVEYFVEAFGFKFLGKGATGNVSIKSKKFTLNEVNLRFIRDNRSSFSEAQMNTLWATSYTVEVQGYSNTSYNGFWWNFYNTKVEDLPEDSLYIETIIAILAGGADAVPVGVDFAFGDTEAKISTVKVKVGQYFAKNEDTLLKLVAFEKYKFTSFDLAITAGINKFLQTNPTIYGLELALYNKETFTDNYYEWSSDNKIWMYKEKVIAAKVDQSLYSSTQAQYQQPFTTIKDVNDILLDEERGFTNFKAGKIERADYWLWGQMTTLASVEGAYADFMVEFMGELKASTDGKYTYEGALMDAIFESQVNSYLNKAFELEVYTGGNNWSGAAYAKRKQTYTPQTFAAKMILDVLRKEAWKQYRDGLKNVSIKDLKNETAEQKKERTKGAFEAGAEKAKNSEAAVGGEPKEGEALSQKEIEARQKFLKQCALMTRLPQLQREHLQTIQKAKSVHKHGTYNDRFYMVKDGDLDQSGIMTKLLLPKGKTIKEFLNITPAVHAHLTPKLRFFKVFDGSSGIEQEEFKFRNFTSRSRVDNLSSRTFDKGGDYGIKEFSFSFEGTTPATAKNDIKANLSLYFQSFQDFIDKGFVDMLLLPKGKSTAEPQESKFAYSPRYYRLRVDVGWNIDSLNVDTLNAKIGSARLGQLKNALIKTNKSFYLNMVDHDINVNVDGSVEIKISYRAYIESALKSPRFDALATPSVIFKTRRTCIPSYIRDARQNQKRLQQSTQCEKV